MKIQQLLDDDDAVSPVIGVILMVAITVILAAVIATFVLGLGEQVSQTTPNANFDSEWASNESVTGGDSNVLTVTHTSGPKLDGEKLSITGATDNVTADIPDKMSAGDEINITVVSSHPAGDPVLAEDDEVSLTWESDGGESAILRTFTAPESYSTDV